MMTMTKMKRMRNEAGNARIMEKNHENILFLF